MVSNVVPILLLIYQKLDFFSPIVFFEPFALLTPKLFLADDAFNPRVKVVRLPLTIQHLPGFMPQAISSNLFNDVIQFHKRPFLWWIGQLIKYATRPQLWLREKIEKIKIEIGFENPIVGYVPIYIKMIRPFDIHLRGLLFSEFTLGGQIKQRKLLITTLRNIWSLSKNGTTNTI